MSKTTKSKKIKQSEESDGNYFLKIVLYIVLGSFWLKFDNPMYVGPLILNGLPIGLLLGLVFASRDHFQVDRKIEYAILIVAAVLAYFVDSGIVI